MKAEGIVYPSFAFSERQFRKAARRAVHSTIAFRCDDGLVEVRPLFERAPHFVDLIEAGPPAKIAATVADLIRQGGGDGRFVLLINLVPVGAPVVSQAHVALALHVQASNQVPPGVCRQKRNSGAVPAVQVAAAG